MKIYGYKYGATNELLSLKSVTLQADPATLRRIALFLRRCAHEIESDVDWEHEHYLDSLSEPTDGPDLIVFRGE